MKDKPTVTYEDLSHIPLEDEIKQKWDKAVDEKLSCLSPDLVYIHKQRMYHYITKDDILNNNIPVDFEDHIIYCEHEKQSKDTPQSLE